MRLPFSVVHIDYCLASFVLDTSCVASSVIDCALLPALRNPSAGGFPSIEAKVIFQPITENIPELDSKRPWNRNGRYYVVDKYLPCTVPRSIRLRQHWWMYVYEYQCSG